MTSRHSSAPHAGPTRRRFLHTLAALPAVLATPILAPASALGQSRRPAPSNRIVLAALGTGQQGSKNLESFLAQTDCQVVAVCDVDKLHAEDAKDLVNRHYKNQDCRVYYDFRHLLARTDLDAISIALPDHWHAIPALQAARAGIDLYGELPLAHTIREGQAIRNAVQRYGRVWQTGSWLRSRDHARFAAELVRNRRIGKVRSIEVGVPAGHPDLAGTAEQQEAETPPPQLDYEFWLGPAPWAPYCPARVHQNWRWHSDYGGGQLLAWVGHYVDLAHWGMGWELAGPLEVEAQGEYPASGLWNTATSFRVDCKYADGTLLRIAAGNPDISQGTRWIGEDGWVWCDQDRLETEPRRLTAERIGAGETLLPRSPGHHRDFLESVKSRRPTLAPPDIAHRSMTPGHLGQIAMMLNRKLHWNPDSESITGDATATRLLGNALREPWRLANRAPDQAEPSEPV